LTSLPRISGLSSLPRLESVALPGNMIPSISLIYTTLGAVTHLDLSYNRLTLLAGLERLHALEVIDLRHNRLRDLAEISRLATLPHIRAIGVEGNPCTVTNDNWRVECFNIFAREGKEVLLDGSGPSFTERLRIVSPSTKAKAKVRENDEAVIAPPSHTGRVLSERSTRSGARLGEEQPPKSDAVVPSKSPRPRRRKPKRVVDLDDSSTTPLPPQPAASGEAAAAGSGGDRDVVSPTSDPGAEDGGGGSSPPSGGNLLRHGRARTEAEEMDSDGGGAEGAGARELRNRIEALRNEAGANWLRVLGETSSGFGEPDSAAKAMVHAGLAAGGQANRETSSRTAEADDDGLVGVQQKTATKVKRKKKGKKTKSGGGEAN
jgi:hypothetical protein